MKVTQPIQLKFRKGTGRSPAYINMTLQYGRVIIFPCRTKDKSVLRGGSSILTNSR